MTHEPRGGERGDLLERVRFHEKMRGTRHDLQLRHAGHSLYRLAVEFQYLAVMATDDEKRWGAHRGEVCAGKIWPTAARKVPKAWLLHRPLGRHDQPAGQQGYVEPQPCGQLISLLLALGQQVEEQRCESLVAKAFRHLGIARTEPAASAPVRNQDEADRVKGEAEQTP
jgi:hypothetical protein